MTAQPALRDREEFLLGQTPEEMQAPATAEARPRRLSVEPAQAPFRRPPVVRRHRKRRAFELLRIVGQALLIVGLPTAAMYWALTSPQFAVNDIRVASSARVPTPWVEARLESVRGQNLLRLYLPEVRQELDDHPWLESVSLRKLLPDVLEVSIVEKTPVAVLEEAEALAFIDAQGERIAPVESPGEAGGLPYIRGIQAGPRILVEAIAAAKEFQRLGASWGGRLESLEILGPEDYRLETDRLPFPLVVRLGSLEEKNETVSHLVPEIASRIENVAAVDLRFAQRIVLQPGPQGEGLIPPSRAPSRG